MENDFKQFVFDKLEIEALEGIMREMMIPMNIVDSFNQAWDEYMTDVPEEEFRQYLEMMDKYRYLLDKFFLAIVSGSVEKDEATLQ